MRFCGSWLAGVNEDYTLTLFKAYSNDGFAISLPLVIPIFRRDINRPYAPNVVDLSDPELVPPAGYPLDFEPCDEEEYVRTHFCDYHVKTTLITADPISDPSRCIVVVVFDDMCELAIMRPWEDTTWTRIIPLANSNCFRSFEGTMMCTRLPFWFTYGTRIMLRGSRFMIWATSHFS